VRKICVILLFATSIVYLLASDSINTAQRQNAAIIQRLVNQTYNNIGDSRQPKVLDVSKLYGLSTNKIGWGIQLQGKNKVPEIPQKTVSLFKKYNAHYVGDTAKKKVYFVFSASYEGGYTPKILDYLKENDVKAVFFLVGTYIKENPQLVKRMIAEGHEIGNHSMTHPSLPVVSDERLKNEIVGLDNYFYENFGKEIKYFMPPSGEYSEKVLAAAKEMDYTSIFWSFAYLDYEEGNQKGAQYAYNKVMSNLHNGAIIFLHTVSKDNANALDSILKDIKREGFIISPMDL